MTPLNFWSFSPWCSSPIGRFNPDTHRSWTQDPKLASYVFYGWWDWRFLSLIALSTA